MKKIVIFGAGRYGKTAIQYYKGFQDIAFVVDNSKKLWGTKLSEYEIKNPEILKTIDQNEYFVILAVKGKEDAIALQLKNYGLKYYVLFNLEERIKGLSNEKCNEGNKRVVSFRSGLGNQLFQYAFYKCLESLDGVPLYADFTPYLFDKRNFVMDRCFTGIKLNKIDTGTIENNYFEPPLLIAEKGERRFPPEEANVAVLKNQKGYFDGYWQSYKFAKRVESVLRQDLIFKDKKDDGLKKRVEKIQILSNTCSVHIRRGDYMSLACKGSLGEVCDITYFERAAEYIKEKEPDVHFLLFSDDPDWVKENMNIPNSTVISEDMFDDYEDWYDMYLMSLCKHNIIANSTFSWWGAWLNNNPDKIVIAPKRWRQDIEIKDICPPEWIRL